MADSERWTEVHTDAGNPPEFQAPTTRVLFQFASFSGGFWKRSFFYIILEWRGEQFKLQFP